MRQPTFEKSTPGSSTGRTSCTATTSSGRRSCPSAGVARAARVAAAAMEAVQKGTTAVWPPAALRQPRLGDAAASGP